MKKQIIFGRKSGPAKTIFGQKSGPAMAGPAVPPTTALKGRNSVANLRKMKLYNPNLDLINVNFAQNIDQ